MNTETMTIPYVLKETTEREMIAQIEKHLCGTIMSVTMIPTLHEGQECQTVIIKYTPAHETREDEYSKSRNYP